MRYWYSEQRSIGIHFWFLIGETGSDIKIPMKADTSLRKLINFTIDACLPGVMLSDPEIITRRFSIRSQHYEHLIVNNYSQALSVIHQIDHADDKWFWCGDHANMIGD
jgi:hypothetical protein